MSRSLRSCSRSSPDRAPKRGDACVAACAPSLTHGRALAPGARPLLRLTTPQRAGRPMSLSVAVGGSLAAEQAPQPVDGQLALAHDAVGAQDDDGEEEEAEGDAFDAVEQGRVLGPPQALRERHDRGGTEDRTRDRPE